MSAPLRGGKVSAPKSCENRKFHEIARNAVFAESATFRAKTGLPKGGFSKEVFPLFHKKIVECGGKTCGKLFSKEVLHNFNKFSTCHCGKQMAQPCGFEAIFHVFHMPTTTTTKRLIRGTKPPFFENFPPAGPCPAFFQISKLTGGFQDDFFLL